MNIIIAGAGKIGASLARQLITEGHDITLIDNDSQVLNTNLENMDVLAIQGNCASLETLCQAGIMDANLLIAATGADEVNLLCCTTAHGANPQLHTIARIRTPEYIDQIFEMRNIFGLSMAFNPEKQAASEIHKLLKYPGFLRRDSFSKGRTEIVELRIDADSKLKNVSMMDMHSIIKCRVLICAVLRNGTAVVPNSGHFTLQEGDRVFVTAPTENLTVLLKNLGIITRKVRRVILCGGGRISYYLADLLQEDGISVQLIDRDHSRCQELTALLPEICVVHGDVTDHKLLDNEGLDTCDAVVTLTGMDELNMIMSLYANSRNIPQVITKLGHTRNRKILDAMALGSVVCPKDLSCNTVIRYVRAMQNQTGAAVSVHAIADGQVEALEFLVDSDTPHIGKPLKELKLKPNVLIASITHGAKTEVPNGNSMFHQGDSLVVVTSGRGVLMQLSDIFA